MKVYVAAPIRCKQEAAVAALQLSMHGITVTSRWILNEQLMPDENRGNDRLLYGREWSKNDREDLTRSDVVLVLYPSSSGTGGTHVELGLALALCKQIVVVGDRPNVFYYSPEVRYYKSVNDAISLLLKNDELEKQDNDTI